MDSRLSIPHPHYKKIKKQKRKNRVYPYIRGRISSSPNMGGTTRLGYLGYIGDDGAWEDRIVQGEVLPTSYQQCTICGHLPDYKLTLDDEGYLFCSDCLEKAIYLLGSSAYDTLEAFLGGI